MNPGINLFTIGGLLQLQIANLTIDNVSSSSLTDTTNIIFGVSTMILGHPYDSKIIDLDYTNSSATLIGISGLVPPTPVHKEFIFENIRYHDCNYTSQNSMLSTEGIVYDTDFEFQFINITLIDIEYATRGFLGNLKHQLPTNLTLRDSHFINIKNGYMNFQSSNLQNTALTTNIVIINSEFDNIQEGSTSLIEVGEGSRLYISNCSFKNIHSFSDGSVLTGGYQNTVTSISDSTFNNNSAVSGGVLNIKDRSIVK